MERGPLADVRLGVVDMHMHPALKTFMLGKDFLKRHHPPGFFFPLTLRTDLEALIAGGVKTFFCAHYIVEKEFLSDCWPLRGVRKLSSRVDHVFAGDPVDLTFECMDHFEALVDRVNAERGPVMEIALSHGDLDRIMAAGKIAVLHSVEGGHSLGGNLETLDRLHARGVCHLIIPHLYPNESCWNVDSFGGVSFLKPIGCFTQEIKMDTGLTDFGRDVVDRMCDLGMMVDMCHATPKARAEIVARVAAHPKKRPVVMSHVGIHAFCPEPMNPTDEEIRAIADTGGVIGIIAMGYFLTKPEKRDCLDVIVKIVEHMVDKGGEDVVAFGSDFDGFTGPPRDFKSPRDYKRVRDALLRRFSEAQVSKFLSENVLRALKSGWDAPARAAEKAAAEAAPAG